MAISPERYALARVRGYRPPLFPSSLHGGLGILGQDALTSVTYTFGLDHVPGYQPEFRKPITRCRFNPKLERTQVGYLNGKCSAAKDEKNRVMIMRCTALQNRGSKLLKLITKPAERVA